MAPEGFYGPQKDFMPLPRGFYGLQRALGAPEGFYGPWNYFMDSKVSWGPQRDFMAPEMILWTPEGPGDPRVFLWPLE